MCPDPCLCFGLTTLELSVALHAERSAPHIPRTYCEKSATILRPSSFPPQGNCELAPGPAASVSVPGLARPLVGFWGVFFEVIAGGPFAFSGASMESGGTDGGNSSSSWFGRLSSELVWKALIHGCRLDALRRGWGDFPSGDEVTNTAAAHGLRRKETSRALWECVRLLLAASPFAEEFSGRGQASAVVATAQAALAVSTAGGGESSPSSLPPVIIAPECAAAPGMVARVLLERVVVLARLRAPEAGPQGVIEKLWGGVQRISAAFSDTDRFFGAGMANGKGFGGESQGVGWSGDERAAAGDDTLEGREGARSRSAKRLSRRSHVATAGEDRLSSEALRDRRCFCDVNVGKVVGALFCLLKLRD